MNAGRESTPFDMIRALICIILVSLPAIAPAAEAKALPSHAELRDLIKANLPGVTEAELNRAATQGLLTHFKGRVLLGNGAVGTNTAAQVSRSTIYEKGFAFIRISRVEAGAAPKVSAAFAKLSKNTKLDGLVIDLRYAIGSDYPAAAQVADLFLTTEQPLIDWGGGSARSTAKEKAITLPIAVLINTQTRGAAEALAAMLRQAGVALLIGSPSAGEASQFKEFTLSDGQNVRLAMGNVKLADGQPLPIRGIAPDLIAKVDASEERALFNDPHAKGPADLAAATTNGSSTNAPRRRINEAELVRLQREGNLPDADSPLPAGSGKAEPARAVLRDAPLARAIDVLKAIAIVQPSTRP